VYGELSEGSQQRLLIQAAERSSSSSGGSDTTLQRARLSLILIKRFPGQATRVGEPLIESLLGTVPATGQNFERDGRECAATAIIAAGKGTNNSSLTRLTGLIYNHLAVPGPSLNHF
jgi:hypothetical protein